MMRSTFLLSVAIILATCATLVQNAAAAATDLTVGKTQSSRPPLAAFLKLGRRRKEYTPLLLFTAPKGAVQECDFMEKMVSQVEAELGVRVERFDVVRDRTARSLYDRIDTGSKQQLPLLYHRESRQSVYGLTDKNRVRAWAKGRWLSADYKPTLPAEFYKVYEDEDAEAALDEEEMMAEEEDLTPLQKKGKERMRQRLEDDAQARKK